jgi:SAM-dependent methyltransferase
MPLDDRARRMADRATPHARAAAHEAKRTTRRLKRRARKALPPAKLRPYALPLAAAVHEARWRILIQRAPTLTGAEHAERVGLRDIEEIIGCSLCGEGRMQPLFSPSGRNGRWHYHVVRCPTCGFLYRHPGIKPARLGELYAGNYDRFLTGRYARNRRRRYRMAMEGFGALLTQGEGRRLLDFGCGAGIFLELAHRLGYEGFGVDLSPESIERARLRPGGKRTYVGSPTEVPEIAAGGFDVITLWSVMAHLPQPVDDLRMLRGLLAPGGVLLIFTVNANSLRLKANGADWNGFTPNHLKFFSPATLTRALALAGLEDPVMPPVASYAVESGNAGLSPAEEHRLRRVIAHGNRGNMLRAVAFAPATAAAGEAQPASENALA